MVPMAPSSTRMRSAAMRRSVCAAGDWRGNGLAAGELTVVLGSVFAMGSGVLPLPEGKECGFG